MAPEQHASIYLIVLNNRQRFIIDDESSSIFNTRAESMPTLADNIRLSAIMILEQTKCSNLDQPEHIILGSVFSLIYGAQLLHLFSSTLDHCR